MAKIVRREIRKHGVFGWIFLLVFLAFNVVMLLWLIAYWSSVSDIAASSDAERAGKAIGATIGTGMYNAELDGRRDGPRAVSGREACARHLAMRQVSSLAVCSFLSTVVL